MTIDVDRLRRELEFVTAEPDRWNQFCWYQPPHPGDATEPGVDWTCGTTACLAGWTALHADYLPWLDADGYLEDETYVVRPGDGPVDERLEDVSDTARDLLGLTDEQAELLFAGSNTLRDLWEFARVFTDDAIDVPPHVARGELGEFEPDDEDYYASLDGAS